MRPLRPALALATLLAACGARTELRTEPPLSPPRPLSPLSTARVTSRRPTLTWEPSRHATGARVELCRDLHCDRIATTIDVDGDHVRPAAALEPGVWYWRLSSRYGDVVAAVHGPVWQFRVPARDTPIDTSWGHTLDLDLDGRSEWVVEHLVTAPPAPNRPINEVIGRIHLFRGTDPLEPSTRPAFTFEGVRGSYRLPHPLALGDLDGDGVPELAASVEGQDGNDAVDGHTYVLHADEVFSHPLITADATSPVLHHPHDTPTRDTLFFVRAVGDVDRDGYADLAGGTTEAAYLFRGGPDGVSMARRELIERADGALAVFPAAAGDVNGDGFADVVVQRRGVVSSVTGLYFGSPRGVHARMEVSDAWWQGDSEWIDANAFGDLNGDGYADVLFTVGGFSRPFTAIVIAWGGASGPRSASRFPLPAEAADSRATYATTAAADYEGDGIDDLMVTSVAPLAVDNTWFASGSTDVADATSLRWRHLETTRAPAVYGFAPDINGDGRADTVDEYRLQLDLPEPVALYVSGPDGPPEEPTAHVVIQP